MVVAQESKTDSVSSIERVLSSGLFVWVFYVLLLLVIHGIRANGFFVIDDPGLLSKLGDPQAPLAEKLFSGTNSNRFRPVTDLVVYVAFLISGTAFFSYWEIGRAHV